MEVFLLFLPITPACLNIIIIRVFFNRVFFFLVWVYYPACFFFLLIRVLSLLSNAKLLVCSHLCELFSQRNRDKMNFMISLFVNLRDLVKEEKITEKITFSLLSTPLLFAFGYNNNCYNKTYFCCFAHHACVL